MSETDFKQPCSDLWTHQVLIILVVATRVLFRVADSLQERSFASISTTDYKDTKASILCSEVIGITGAHGCYGEGTSWEHRGIMSRCLFVVHWQDTTQEWSVIDNASIMGYAASFFQLYEIQYHHFTTLGLTWYPFRVAWLLWLSTWNDPWRWSSSDQVTNPNHQSTCTRPIVSRPVDTKTFRLITPSNRVPTAFPVQREWLVIRIGQLPYAPSVGTNLPFSNRSNQRSYLPTLIQSNLGEWYFISFTVPVVLVTVQLAYNFTWLWVAPHPINSFLPMHMGLHPNFLSHLLQPFSADSPNNNKANDWNNLPSSTNRNPHQYPATPKSSHHRPDTITNLKSLEHHLGSALAILIHISGWRHSSNS